MKMVATMIEIARLCRSRVFGQSFQCDPQETLRRGEQRPAPSDTRAAHQCVHVQLHAKLKQVVNVSTLPDKELREYLDQMRCDTLAGLREAYLEYESALKVKGEEEGDMEVEDDSASSASESDAQSKV